MNPKTASIVLCFLTLISCDFRKSVNKNLKTGMVTKGNGLSCEDVFLTVDEETIERNTFTYGEEFILNFNNMEGFERMDNHASPGMSLLVTDEHGDTLLKKRDLYADLTNGTDHSPLLLMANVMIADPIHSKGSYTLLVSIWDKKSDGLFTAKFDFDVLANDQIVIESDHTSYREIFLYSQQRQQVITDNRAGFSENIYMMFEGLEGFSKEGNMVSIGLSLMVEDASGKVLVNEEDLIGESGFQYSEFHTQMAANFILTGSQVNNPVKYEIYIWDKKGEGLIRATTQLHIE